MISLYRLMVALAASSAMAAPLPPVVQKLRQIFVLETAFEMERSRYDESLFQIGYEPDPAYPVQIELIGKKLFIATICDVRSRFCRSIDTSGNTYVDSLRSQRLLQAFPEPKLFTPGDSIRVQGRLQPWSIPAKVGKIHRAFQLEFPTPQAWRLSVSDTLQGRWMTKILFEPDSSRRKLFQGLVGKSITVSGIFRAADLVDDAYYLGLESPQLIP